MSKRIRELLDDAKLAQTEVDNVLTRIEKRTKKARAKVEAAEILSGMIRCGRASDTIPLSDEAAAAMKALTAKFGGSIEYSQEDSFEDENFYIITL
jgi:hypothetical protein